MSMFPIKENLSNIAINKIFLEKSSLYTSNASSFYMAPRSIKTLLLAPVFIPQVLI